MKRLPVHLLVVAIGFPSPDNPYSGRFIGEQVRILAERVERITVLAPVPKVPWLLSRVPRFASKAALPDRYNMVSGRCEVLFPRYLKAPGDLFLAWTTGQWCRLVCRTIAHFAETFPVSMLHAHYGSVSSWASICAARRYRLPCAVTYHGSEVHTTLAFRRKGWKLCRDSFRLADLNLPVSRSIERILRRYAQPTGRCETLLLGVDQNEFFPAPNLCATPRVIYIGRIQRAKGVFDLLSAWTKVTAACPQAQLLMVGEDYTEGLFWRQAQSLGIGDSIVLMGPQPRVAELLRQSRLMCLPSYGEGMPTCVMEALACGVPVVATRVGGIPEIIDHGRTGILVAKGDRKGLAHALIELIRNPSMCARMGEAAQRYASLNLDIRRTADRLLELYGELLAGHYGVRPSEAAG